MTTLTLYYIPTCTPSDLVEQIDLGDHISGVPRVAYQHDDQFDKGIHSVVALSTSHRCIDRLWGEGEGVGLRENMYMYMYMYT
jgi:hypothetical protein